MIVGVRILRDLLCFAQLSPFNCEHLTGSSWCIPLVPELEEQRWTDLFEFEATLTYTVSFRTAKDRATEIPYLSGVPRVVVNIL